MSTSSPPVAVFAFNRPRHLLRTLNALAANHGARGSVVHVFCDGARSPADLDACTAVRQVALTATGFAEVYVTVRERNMGCAESVIIGISAVLEKQDRVIVIEDDVITSPEALRFLTCSLERYASVEGVFSIAAWAPPFTVVPASYPYNGYFFPRFHCWGWATWRNRWNSIDWSVPFYRDYMDYPFLQAAHRCGGDDLPAMLQAQLAGKIDSWAIRAEYARFVQGGLTLYPRQPLALNIGMDGSGRHCSPSSKYGAVLAASPVGVAMGFPNHVCVDSAIARRFGKIYKQPALPQIVSRELANMVRAWRNTPWRRR